MNVCAGGPGRGVFIGSRRGAISPPRQSPKVPTRILVAAVAWGEGGGLRSCHLLGQEEPSHKPGDCSLVT